jgi:signal transduction histidine kinase
MSAATGKGAMTGIKVRAGSILIGLAVLALGAHAMTRSLVRKVALGGSGEVLALVDALSLTGIFLVFACLIYLASRLIWPLIRSLEAERDKLEALAMTLERKVDERTSSLKAREDELKRQIRVLQALVEQLQDMSQQRSDFLGAVSHEMKTPLAALKGSLVLLRKVPSESDREKLLASLERNAERLGRQVDNVLASEALEGGLFKTESRPLDLRGLVEGAVRALEQVSAKHRLELAWEAGEAELMGDAFRLEQVFLNLLSNAIKYSPRGGAVRVRGLRLGGAYEISVEDEGLGIPEAMMGQLFRKYERIRQPSHQGIPGTGLGLYLVKEIVERHGGEVRAENRPGGGSIFRVRLPVPPVGGEASFFPPGTRDVGKGEA